jgi:hypothetical protein
MKCTIDERLKSINGWNFPDQFTDKSDSSVWLTDRFWCGFSA